MVDHQPISARAVRAQRCLRRSRRSPSTRSCPIATPARSSRPTEAWTGCAFPSSMRRACSAACSTERRARSDFGPFGINVPSAHRYEPGTNVLETTWKTPSGWVVVRDALIMGPTLGPDTVTPHTRPPADDDAGTCWCAPRSASTAGSRWNWSASQCSTTAVRRPTGRWSDETLHAADASGRTQRSGCAPTCCWASRATGFGPGTCCAPARSSTARCRGPTARRARRLRPGPRAHRRRRSAFWRAWLDRARIPDHRWREPIQRSALASRASRTCRPARRWPR